MYFLYDSYKRFFYMRSVLPVIWYCLIILCGTFIALYGTNPRYLLGMVRSVLVVFVSYDHIRVFAIWFVVVPLVCSDECEVGVIAQ